MTDPFWCRINGHNYGFAGHSVCVICGEPRDTGMVIRKYDGNKEPLPDHCPGCRNAFHIQGEGSQINAWLLTMGEVRDSAVYGAVTRYQCRKCGLVWDMGWEDGMTPMA